MNLLHPLNKHQKIGNNKKQTIENLFKMNFYILSYAYRDRMLSMLYVVKEELPDPLYFDNAKLARVMHTHMPQNKVIK
jgi:tRNA G26 N,N-dimethylase Trm1